MRPILAADFVETVANIKSWDERVAQVRLIPELFGTSQHQQIYSAIAERVYVPCLAPDFAYVHWREEYELAPLENAYQQAFDLTQGFSIVSQSSLATAISTFPECLRVFRLMLGLTAQEFAACTNLVAEEIGTPALKPGTIKNIEAGGRCPEPAARCCAEVIDQAMSGKLFPDLAGTTRSKLSKPDTTTGWETIRDYAAGGVPLPIFLHQRLYGGAFRQLLDATSSKRGDLIEDAVQEVFEQNGISFVRTGSHNQEEIARRFQITVKPAPDFVFFDSHDILKAMLECKGANDGGTARDKASRFASLRRESIGLGGIPLFAVLAGLGWKRTSDALGPVIRDTDGRTLTLANVSEIMNIQPFPSIRKHV